MSGSRLARRAASALPRPETTLGCAWKQALTVTVNPNPTHPTDVYARAFTIGMAAAHKRFPRHLRADVLCAIAAWTSRDAEPRHNGWVIILGREPYRVRVRGAVRRYLALAANSNHSAGIALARSPVTLIGRMPSIEVGVKAPMKT